MCYFYLGVIIVFILGYFKYKEDNVEDTNEVKLEDNIVNLAAISSGTDANDFFSMRMPVPKRRSKTVQYKIKIKDENEDHNGILSSILEGTEKEESNEKDDNSEKNFS